MGIQSSIARRSPVRQAPSPIRHMQSIFLGFAALMILGILFFHLYTDRGTGRVPYGYVPPLPIADSASLYCRWDPLQLQISRSGEIYSIEGTSLDTTKLRQTLSAYITKNNALRIKSKLRIRMDPNCKASAATSLIQIAQAEGYRSITFAVRG
jgi:hypothetical protein